MEEPTSERIREQHRSQNPMKWFGAFMALFYIGMAIFLYFDKTYSAGVQPDLKNLFALLLFVYGGFRLWRTWADYWK